MSFGNEFSTNRQFQNNCHNITYHFPSFQESFPNYGTYQFGTPTESINTITNTRSFPSQMDICKITNSNCSQQFSNCTQQMKDLRLLNNNCINDDKATDLSAHRESDYEFHRPYLKLTRFAKENNFCSGRNPGAPSTPEEYLIVDGAHEIYSRKVFVGGLPIDVSEEEISSTFSQFGPVHIDWPRRLESSQKDCSNQLNRSRSMTGYVFLVFENELSVRLLVTTTDGEKGFSFRLYTVSVSFEKMIEDDKRIRKFIIAQIRPWRLCDIEYMPNPDSPLDPRLTVFLGGLPRPTKAGNVYGTVSYVGIDIDPELKYPKGAARVAFSSISSFISAIRDRFFHMPHTDITKRVEIKPYVMEGQMCDECNGSLCSGRYASYFCGDICCLQYYCEICWDRFHYAESVDAKRSSHKAIMRSGNQIQEFMHPPHHKRCYENSSAFCEC
ncbi:unnamed protein product [Dracunculus medinensis]|uniref:Cytoplasmic polyadenylation element-binding protein 1 n=1 Tax=Dracunculus medinensis TaxID=318479 RepID=A0A0N4UB63_DRAME|nr:unnamed protein product [Dracunculus medinensis]